MWILALDVGTSSIRAIGYDALGRPLPGADARVGPPGPPVRQRCGAPRIL